MIDVGVCSNPTKKIFESFKLLEIQRTFYNIIKEETAKKWRKNAPEDFKFTVKAFQGITHSSRSPTWKKSNVDVSKIKDKVGGLKVNEVIEEFVNYINNIARILKAEVILIQLPASFKDNKENIEGAFKFFESYDFVSKVAVELRGWSKENRKKICEEFNLIDVVDPFYEECVTEEIYFRLHGRRENGKIIYRYKYSDDELRKLAEIVQGKNGYVLFNNSNMFEDARRFKEIMG